MKHIKDGVQLAHNTQLQLVDGIVEATVVYTEMGYPFVITSLGEGTHLPNSLHYKGAAFDCRSRHVKVAVLPTLLRELKTRLGVDWDIVLEEDHVHVEYDPKTPQAHDPIADKSI